MSDIKILILEDETISAMELQYGLRELGYPAIDAASSGEEALRKVQESLPDVALLDIHVEGDIDGIQVAERLRDDFDVPVIFLTAYADEGILKRAKATRPYGFLLKPYENRLLRTTIEMAVYKHQFELQFQQHAAQLAETNKHLELQIVERRKQEAALRQLNEALEQRVRERTLQLEVTNQELQRFAYSVSHDLKAPLRGINQLSHWLVQDYADAIDREGKEMFELLADRVKQMENLINGILKYSRTGSVAADPETLDLNALLRETLDLLAPSASCDMTIAPDFPKLVADKARISQVFQNLLSNALKFADADAPKISVGWEDDGQFWQFWVKDNGKGIEPGQQDKIFQLFYSQGRQVPEGTAGIGLSIVKKIVESYGGAIRVESAVDEGSAFHFTLPKNL